MTKKSITIFIVLLLTLILSSCDKGKFLSSITGSPYEILVVANRPIWKTAAGETVVSVLEKDMPSMPQAEPTLSVSKCQEEEFTSMLKPTRNILIIDINPKKYTRTRIAYSHDRWAKPQSVAHIITPDADSLKVFMKDHGDIVTNYFVKAELDRETTFLNSKSNKQIEKMIYDQFGISIKVPVEIYQYKKGNYGETSALWLSCGIKEPRQDMIIYSYPYTDIKQLTTDSLINRRDSVCKRLIPGPIDGSYMGTEKRYDYPVYRKINKGGEFCAEIRGLWKVYGGGSMGGPYISHTMIDKLHQRIITVEGYVYAPQQKKRSAIRKMEAVIGTENLPIVLNDVVIENKK